MSEMITLSQAADEFNIFYLDLLNILHIEGIRNESEVQPSDLISLSKIVELENLGVIPNRDQWKGFGTSRYIHSENIRKKYAQWIVIWMNTNRSEYDRFIHKSRHRFVGESIAEPASFEDLCAVLIAYCGGGHSEMNTIFSRGLRFELFKCYTEFIDKGISYTSIEDIDNIEDLTDIIFMHGEGFNTYIKTVDDISVNIINAKTEKVSKRIRKDVKQWAYYYALLYMQGYYRNDIDAGITEFFEEKGNHDHYDGHYVNQVFNKMRSSKNLREEMCKRGAEIYVERAIDMLKANHYSDVAEFARSEYKKRFEK